MRALVALLLCLWLPAHAGPCTVLTVRCPELSYEGVVRGKTIVDPLALATQAVTQPFLTDEGASGLVDSVVFDGVVMYRVRMDQGAQAPLAALTLTRPDQGPQSWGWLENAAGDLRPDWVLQDQQAPQDVSFAFANGLQAGQASRWVVDLAGGPLFAPVAPGIATDLAGGTGKLPLPLLAPVPEPGSAALLLGGLAALALRRRRA